MAAIFSASVQTGPGAHPASCTMGTGSFSGLKRPGRGADYQPPSSDKVEGRVGLYICSPSGPSWPVIGRTECVLNIAVFCDRTKLHDVVSQQTLIMIITVVKLSELKRSCTGKRSKLHPVLLLGCKERE